MHGEYNLGESAAIVVYLADTFGIDSHWYPKNIQNRGRINAYLHWHHTNTRFHCRGFVYHTVIGPLYYGLQAATPQYKMQLENDLGNFMSDFSNRLGSDYICGKDMTFSDIFAFN